MALIYGQERRQVARDRTPVTCEVSSVCVPTPRAYSPNPIHQRFQVGVWSVWGEPEVRGENLSKSHAADPGPSARAAATRRLGYICVWKVPPRLPASHPPRRFPFSSGAARG